MAVNHTRNDLQRLVAVASAEALGLDPSGLDPNERLSRYGLTSRLAVGLIARLSADLGRPLPATLAWDHPTIARLVRFFSGEMDEQRMAGIRRLPDEEPVAIVSMACRLPGAADPE